MSHETDLLNALKGATKRTHTFTCRGIHHGSKGKKTTKEIKSARKQLSVWITWSMRRGDLIVGDFKITVFNRSVPVKYIATRI